MPIYVKFTHERHVRPFVNAFDQAFPNIEWKWVDHPTSDHKRYLSMPFCQAPNIPGVLWEEDLWVCAEHDEEGDSSIPVYLVYGTVQGNFEAACTIQKAFREFRVVRMDIVKVHRNLPELPESHARSRCEAIVARLMKGHGSVILCYFLAAELELVLMSLKSKNYSQLGDLLSSAHRITKHFSKPTSSHATKILVVLKEFEQRLHRIPAPDQFLIQQINSVPTLIKAAQGLHSAEPDSDRTSQGKIVECLTRAINNLKSIKRLPTGVLCPLLAVEKLLTKFPSRSYGSAMERDDETESDSGSETESEDEHMVDTSAFPAVLEVTRDPQFSYPTIAKAVDSVAPRHPHEPYSWLVSAEDLPKIRDGLKARGLRLQELFFDDTNKYMKIIPTDHARYEENALLLVAKDLRCRRIMTELGKLTDSPWTQSESHWQCTVPYSTLDKLQAIGLLPHSDDDEGTFRVAPNDDNDPRYKPRTSRPSRKRKAGHSRKAAKAAKKAKVQLRDITEEEFVQEWLAVYEETGATPKTPQELRAIFKKYKHTHSTPAREWSAQENRACGAMLTELGIEAECVELNQMLPEGATMRSNEPVPQANLLVVREFAQQLGIDMDLLLQQLEAKPMDTLKWSRRAPKTNGKQNKLARHNCCITDGEEEGEEIEDGVKITHPKNPEIIFTCWKYQAFLQLLKFRWRYAAILGPYGYKVYDQFHELNKYYQKSCGIGRHGDIERGSHGSCGMVNCLKVGFHLPLLFSWYKDCKPAGRTEALSPLDPTKASFPVVSMEKKKKGQVQWTTSTVAAVVTLGHGDHYQMSAKAIGKDWRKKDWALRHCAGARKYTGLPKTFYQAIEQKYGSKHNVAYSLTGSDRVENDSESPELQFSTRFDGM